MKKKIVFMLSLVLILMVGGCSSNKKNDSASTKGNKVTQSTKTEQKGGAYKFYKDAKNNSRIYYRLAKEDIIGKDARVVGIIYVNHGKACYYLTLYSYLPKGTEPLTLGSLKEKSNDEILQIAKKYDEMANVGRAQNINKKSKKQLEELNSISKELLDTKNDGGLDASEFGGSQKYREALEYNIKSTDDYKYKEPTLQDMRVEAISDSSGNNIAKEAIYLSPTSLDLKYYKIETQKADSGYIGYTYVDKMQKSIGINFAYVLNNLEGSSEIYDKNYIHGNFVPVESEDEVLMVTEVPKDKNITMELDDLNEKGIKEVKEFKSEEITWE